MAAPTLNTARTLKTAQVFDEVYIGDVAAEDDASGKFGWGVTPVGKRTTYTETYNTPARTIPAATASTLVLTGTNIAAKTASLTLTDAVNTNAGTVATSLDQAQKDIGTALNLVSADVLALKKLVVALVQDMKALGFVKAA